MPLMTLNRLTTLVECSHMQMELTESLNSKFWREFTLQVNAQNLKLSLERFCLLSEDACRKSSFSRVYEKHVRGTQPLLKDNTSVKACSRVK